MEQVEKFELSAAGNETGLADGWSRYIAGVVPQAFPSLSLRSEAYTSKLANSAVAESPAREFERKGISLHRSIIYLCHMVTGLRKALRPPKKRENI